MVDISVLLTVRDWNLTRVEMCLRSIQRNSGVDSEIVVIDYGSSDAEGIADLAQRFGCVFKRVEATEWSRSNAMNAAAEISSGRNLIFADADLVFSPSVLSRTAAALEKAPDTVLMFQFRDLPPGIEPSDLLDEPDYCMLDALATWRPRWGMGVQAYSRKVYDRVRGFDDRMKIYGGEDNDIAKRARGFGSRLEWVNGPEFGLYHVWHPSSREIADSTPETKAELAKNVDIAKNDNSIVRNLSSGIGDGPLVSVVISTYNRAEFLSESIESALSQSVRNIEVLVLDDGSTDDTRTVVESIDDSRLRYYQFPKMGIPAIRNRGIELTRGRYTAIHDDDDIMLPWSLEVRLKAIQAGDAGSYGGAYDFSNDNGEMTLFAGRNASLDTVLNGAKVFYHATLLIDTSVLSGVRYEDLFSSGSDFNLALRLMKVGARVRHCNDIVLLRRLHSRQVTVTDQVVQHGASYASTFAQRVAWSGGSRWKSREQSRAVVPWEYPSETVETSRFVPYLPAHLVDRSVLVIGEKKPDWVEDVPHLEGQLESNGELFPILFVPTISVARFAELNNYAEEGVHVVTTPRGSGAASSFEALRQALVTVLGFSNPSPMNGLPESQRLAIFSGRDMDTRRRALRAALSEEDVVVIRDLDGESNAGQDLFAAWAGEVTG